MENILPAAARRQIVNNEKISTYNCTQRCVRRAFLCGKGPLGEDYEHRKKWIKDRLILLTDIFFIEILSYAVMSNHLHTQPRVRPDIAEQASNKEICERWWRLFPGKHTTEKKALLQDDTNYVEKIRKRLHNLSWFMKCLNEYIAKKANKEDGVTGHFWEGRYKSQILLDSDAIISVATYIDLNPYKANIENEPSLYQYSSWYDRIHRCKNRIENFLVPFEDFILNVPNKIKAKVNNENDYLNILTKKAKIFSDTRKAPDLSHIFSHSIGLKDNLIQIAHQRNLEWIKGYNSEADLLYYI